MKKMMTKKNLAKVYSEQSEIIESQNRLIRDLSLKLIELENIIEELFKGETTK